MDDEDVCAVQPQDRFPPLIRRIFRSECPVCHEKWLASRWDPVRYSMHYASRHLGIPIWRKL